MLGAGAKVFAGRSSIKTLLKSTDDGGLWLRRRGILLHELMIKVN